MSIAAVVTLPFTIASSHYVLSHPATLGRLAVVAVMAIVLGFACELQALRRLKPSTAGVLFALDPAVAFVIGLIVLSQSIHPWDLVGMVCVVIAGAGVTYDAANSETDPRSVGFIGGNAQKIRHSDLRVPDERARLRAPRRSHGRRRHGAPPPTNPRPTSSSSIPARSARTPTSSSTARSAR